MSLSDFIRDKEWYDNAFLDLVLSCPRKAFYSRVYNLSMGVGPGADFGSCIHAGIASYYLWWNKCPEEKRRLKAFRAFLSLHEKLFKGPRAEELDNKHSRDAGVLMLDHYFDTHFAEDELLQPVEIELAGAIEIKPQPTDPFHFKPFWYTFRIDGIHKRLRYGDFWIRETKTTSGGASRELKKLKLSRQPTGYLWCARQFPGVIAAGVIPDVVSVAAKTREALRDFYFKSQKQTEDWRLQTINIVEYWRQLVRLGVIERDEDYNPIKVDLNQFYQNTKECTTYGLCAYYALCDFGINSTTLRAFQPNTWNPLANVDEIPDEVQKQTVQEEDRIKESIKL